MSQPKNRVELRHAYEWTCEECGRDNYERARVWEPTAEEAEEARIEQGVQPWETGNWLTRPDDVKCKHCGAEFECDDFEGGEE